MHKVGISGSWRIATMATSPAIEEIKSAVQESVETIIQVGDGIVSGGALGVDFWATETALKYASVPDQIKIIIPTPLNIYLDHYRQKSAEGAIDESLYHALKFQLNVISARFKLIEMSYSACTPETYYSRNTEVVLACNVLNAFVVNGSAGTMDTVTKANNLGKPVKILAYSLAL